MSTQTTTLTPPQSDQPLAPETVAPPTTEARTGRASDRLWRGHTEDPPWARPALLGLLAATALLYLWGLGASGWANSFYSCLLYTSPSPRD